jgi:hypothetical protein
LPLSTKKAWPYTNPKHAQKTPGASVRYRTHRVFKMIKQLRTFNVIARKFGLSREKT